MNRHSVLQWEIILYMCNVKQDKYEDNFLKPFSLEKLANGRKHLCVKGIQDSVFIKTTNTLFLGGLILKWLKKTTTFENLFLQNNIHVLNTLCTEFSLIVCSEEKHILCFRLCILLQFVPKCMKNYMAHGPLAYNLNFICVH